MLDSTHARPTDNALSDVWFDETDIDVGALRKLIEQETHRDAVPAASDIVKNIPVYAASTVDAAFADPQAHRQLAAEWHRVLAHGAGVLVVRNAWNGELTRRVSDLFRIMLDEEAATGKASGDHFAKAGANARVWNAHEKLALQDADAFVEYNANRTLALASSCWLGPLYRVTAQLNLVRPGGTAQDPHRDYHMGFQPREVLLEYPVQSHRLSASLTLQGAVAHADIPIASGSTRLLPFSQTWPPGYLCKGHEEVDAVFAENHVQVDLRMGDAVFFNPALLHAAGDNTTKYVERLANLLQINSSWGRCMEVVDGVRIACQVFPALRAAIADGRLDSAAVERVIAASVDGYAFPANLELEPPRGHLPPASQQDVLRQALAEQWSQTQLETALTDQQALKRSH